MTERSEQPSGPTVEQIDAEQRQLIRHMNDLIRKKFRSYDLDTLNERAIDLDLLTRCGGDLGDVDRGDTRPRGD